MTFKGVRKVTGAGVTGGLCTYNGSSVNTYSANGGIGRIRGWTFWPPNIKGHPSLATYAGKCTGLSKESVV